MVVVLFGGPGAPQDRSIESLLQVLEAAGGDSGTEIPLPRANELSEAAFELYLRLEGKDAELTDARLASVAKRVAAVIDAERRSLERSPAPDPQLMTRDAIRSRRLAFLIHALGRTRRPEAIDPLLEIVRAGQEPYVRTAMQELGNLHGLVDARRAIGPIVEVLQRPCRPETHVVACTALSVLAGVSERRVIDALDAVRLSSEGEVTWSAALALARLGSTKGKSTLLDLLDRSFLEEVGRYETRDAAGNVRRYRLPAGRVEEVLIAAMTAAANLDDADIRDSIMRLTSDPSPVVRGKAAETLDEHT